MLVASLETRSTVMFSFLSLEAADSHTAPNGAQSEWLPPRCHKYVVPNGTHFENLKPAFSQALQ